MFIGYNLISAISDIESRVKGMTISNSDPVAHLSPSRVRPRRGVRIRQDDGEARRVPDFRAEDHHVRFFLGVLLFEYIA